MKELLKWLERAEKSKKAVTIVSFLFYRLIPFNRPHGITVESIEKHAAQTRLPYKKRNWNHLKGMHACALATAAEFSAGIVLLKTIDPEKYRLIMRRISVEYTAQGRTDVLARAELPASARAALLDELSSAGVAEVTVQVNVRDISGKEICVAQVLWQLKEWSQVRSG